MVFLFLFSRVVAPVVPVLFGCWLVLCVLFGVGRSSVLGFVLSVGWVSCPFALGTSIGVLGTKARAFHLRMVGRMAA